jgi:hypothetical protein
VARAGTQPYTSSGGDVGMDYVLGAIERILPDSWSIAEHEEGTVPYRWKGPDDALEVKLEDRSLQIRHPAGFEYHPFIRLFFCPGEWVGSMQETDYYGDQDPALLLGKNHIFRVFYQPRGLIRWDNVYEQLAIAFDLTRPPVERDLRLQVDTGLRSRLEQRVSSVVHDLPPDVLDRLAGLEREGNLLYVEYVATVANPPAAPGAPPLVDAIREIIETETEELARQLFQILPEVRTIYVRRLCDNRLFDRILDRDAMSSLSSAAGRR